MLVLVGLVLWWLLVISHIWRLLLDFFWLQPHSKPTVTWEDQQNINKFSNAFQRQGELQGLIQNQKVVFP